MIVFDKKISNIKAGAFYILFTLIPVLTITSCTGNLRNANLSVERTGTVAGKKKVAVLPFNNISGRTDAGRIVTNLFVTELFNSGRFVVIEPGNILQFMREERVKVLGEIDLVKLQLLSRRFDLDGVIVGTVLEFNDGTKGARALPVVSMNARMIEPVEGRIVWSAQDKKEGADFITIFGQGRVRAITSLAQKIIRNFIYTIM